MNFIHFLLCITKNPITIKNINLPVCANCRHFIGYKYNPNENLEMGKCRLFGKKNIVTG